MANKGKQRQTKANKGKRKQKKRKKKKSKQKGKKKKKKANKAKTDKKNKKCKKKAKKQNNKQKQQKKTDRHLIMSNAHTYNKCACHVIFQTLEPCRGMGAVVALAQVIRRLWTDTVLNRCE